MNQTTRIASAVKPIPMTPEQRRDLYQRILRKLGGIRAEMETLIEDDLISAESDKSAHMIDTI